jgi:hypothetical protein
VAPRENTDVRSLALLWAQAARHAGSIEELVELSNSYFDTWAWAREVSYLPSPCQPRRVSDLEALLSYALEVYQCYRSKVEEEETAEILEALVIFTEAVTLRASLLGAGTR